MPSNPADPNPDDADLIMSVIGDDAASANEMANDLAEAIRQDAPGTSVMRIRSDPLSQDFGTLLAIVLGSTAASALARGIAYWVARRQDASLQLRRTSTDGQVRELAIHGQASARAERLISEFFAD